ncbi:type II toxin-antitoxin system RelE/ParE family toxin [Streptomyces sp. SID8361]|nr:type II toxin-antitoxin system RelE/ParE family toxin [Streptomyces sp. SID8361]MYX61049.1 type II toxin-antitoxin system RelE/ParE family toxin [Streptomyces sp. SID8382]
MDIDDLGMAPGGGVRAINGRGIGTHTAMVAPPTDSAPSPYARPLREGVAELRPSLDGIQTRVTFWITDDRRIVLLTVFRKTRAHEEAQINRAVLAKKECEAEHSPAHTDFTREEGDQ